MPTFKFAGGLAGATLLAVMLAGCETKVATLTPDVQAGMMTDLQQGKLTLDCGIKCDFTWISQVPQIHALDIAERWNDLAVRVMQIGYGNDLAYYYLGQAAQGLGYHQAAISYYNYALALSVSPDPTLRCGSNAGAGDNCQGVDIAGSVPVLIQASKDALAQQQQEAADAAAAAAPAPVHHHHHKPAATATQWVAPPPAAAGGSSGSSPGGGSSWSAPPPPAQN